jgi:hypothetical protein
VLIVVLSLCVVDSIPFVIPIPCFIDTRLLSCLDWWIDGEGRGSRAEVGVEGNGKERKRWVGTKVSERRPT